MSFGVLKSAKGTYLCVFSVTQSWSTLQPHGLQHARLPCPSLYPGVFSNSCPLSWWCHSTISSSVSRFSSCLQSFPASGSFPVGWLFTSGSQRIGVSASVLPMNIQCWFSLGLTGLISLLSKGPQVFSSSTIRKYLQRSAFFLVQEIFLSQGSNPYLLHLLHWQADSLLLHLGSLKGAIFTSQKLAKSTNEGSLFSARILLSWFNRSPLSLIPPLRNFPSTDALALLWGHKGTYAFPEAVLSLELSPLPLPCCDGSPICNSSE